MPQLEQFQGRPNISGNLPSSVVDEGDLGRALTATGAALGAQLGQMADRAAAREGEAAGMNAGAAAGERLLQRQSIIAKAQARKAKAPGEHPVPEGVSPLADTPLQLRRDGTIRGEAFDQAARQAIAWRADTALTAALGKAAITHQDDPQGYEAAAAAARSQFLKDVPELGADPKLREAFDQRFTQALTSDQLQLLARQEAKSKAAASAAAADNLDTRAVDLERQAFNLGAFPGGEWAIHGQLATHLGKVDEAVRTGALTKTQGKAAKLAAETGVARGRIMGVYEALGDPAAQQQYANGLLEQWSAGKGSIASLSLDQVQAISNQLYGQATNKANLAIAADKGTRAKYETLVEDDVAQTLATGGGLDFGAAGVDVPTMVKALGPDKAEEWRKKRDDARLSWDATSGMELMSGPELSARVDALKPTAGADNFSGRQAAYETAQKRMSSLLEERKADPLGQAARGGLIKSTAIDMSSPETFGNTLKERQAEAHTVSTVYGTPYQFFRPEEASRLVNQLTANPQLIPTFATSMNAALGPEVTAKALGELGQAGPELAYAAGLQLETADSSVAEDVARVMAQHQDKTFKGAKLPEGGALGDAAGTILGDAFAHNDTARSAVVGTANLLFEADANRLGFDPSEVKKPGSAANAAYGRAIDRALGGKTTPDGTKYGGLGKVNGGAIVVPPNLPADAPQQLVSNFRETDLNFLPPIASANGIKVSAAELRDAHLVTIGNGIYRVALGDPQGLDPQFLTGADGRFWLLDIGALAALHRLPSYVPPAPIDNLIEGFRAPAGANSP